MNSKIKYVITGGPGSGKTTTVNKFAKEGYLIVKEAAREVIRELREKGLDIKTWEGDVNERQLRILDMQLKLEDEAEDKTKPGKNIIFLDRGIPDGIAFYRISKTKIPEKLIEESKPEKRNYLKVFFLEQIPYKQDAVRKEPEEIAKKISELIREIYTGLGYEVISVPDMPLNDRVRFIKDNI